MCKSCRFRKKIMLKNDYLVAKIKSLKKNDYLVVDTAENEPSKVACSDWPWSRVQCGSRGQVRSELLRIAASTSKWTRRGAPDPQERQVSGPLDRHRIQHGRGVPDNSSAERNVHCRGWGWAGYVCLGKLREARW